MGEPGPLGSGGLGEGVAVGLSGGDGQAVAPGYAVLLEEGENAQKGPGHGGLMGLALLVLFGYFFFQEKVTRKKTTNLRSTLE